MSLLNVNPRHDFLTGSKAWGILEDLSVSLTDFVEDTDVGAAPSASNNSR
jgi:hypothetical protein